MNIDDFIEYAKIIRKYRPLLKELEYYVLIYEDYITLDTMGDYGPALDLYSIKELDNELKQLSNSYKEQLERRLKDKKLEIETLEILIKTIDNAN